MGQPSIHFARKRSALAIFNPLEVFDDNHFDLAEVNLFDLSRQLFLDLLARVFLSFVETLNLGMEFLRDLLAVRENQAVSIVGIHPHYPAFRFWLRRLFLKDQSGKGIALLQSPPLRTVRATFIAHGSSLSNAPFRGHGRTTDYLLFSLYDSSLQTTHVAIGSLPFYGKPVNC